MKSRLIVSFVFVHLALFAQKQELGLTLGGIVSQTRSSAGLNLNKGTALQANYGYRVYGGSEKPVAVYANVHFLASPLRQVASGNGTLTRDVASLYATPGVIVKFGANNKVVPWVTGGGGWGVYEHSTTLLNGAANPVPRSITTGALVYGAGLDVPLWRFVRLRFEGRDFYTGSPRYNVAGSASRQHNVVLGGGFLIRWGGN